MQLTVACKLCPGCIKPFDVCLSAYGNEVICLSANERYVMSNVHMSFSGENEVAV